MPVALEQITMPPSLQVSPQFLCETWQHGNVTAAVSFGVRDVNLRRVAFKVDIFDTDVNELFDPRPGEEERLNHQSVFTLCLVAALDKPFDFRHVEPLDAALAGARRIKVQLATHLFDDVLALVVVQMSFAPQSHRLCDHIGESLLRMRFCQMTTHFAAL